MHLYCSLMLDGGHRMLGDKVGNFVFVLVIFFPVLSALFAKLADRG